MKDTVAFAPVFVELANNKKAVITEADLEDYPGMFLTNGKTTNGLRGDFAPYVLDRSAKRTKHCTSTGYKACRLYC